MADQKLSKGRFRLVLVILGAVALSLVYLLARSRAQGDVAAYLDAQLKHQGVPVLSVSTNNSQLPIQADVEIVIQSDREGGKSNAEDLWNVFLAHREATLAYRSGYSIKSYAIILKNPRGENIKEGIGFLYPEFTSQQPFHVPPKIMDNETAKKLIVERMDWRGFALDSLEVITGTGSLADIQMAAVQLSTPDIQQANTTLAQFMFSLKPFFESLNAEDGVRIAIVKLRLIDKQGEVLLDYILDMEIDRTSWFMADGVTTTWFPHPPESSPKETPPEDQIGDAYPPPATLTLTPTPTLTPVPTAYP